MKKADNNNPFLTTDAQSSEVETQLVNSKTKPKIQFSNHLLNFVNMKTFQKLLITLFLVITTGALFAQKSVTVTVNPKPVVTVTNQHICPTVTSVTLPYDVTNYTTTAPTVAPDKYRIDFTEPGITDIGDGTTSPWTGGTLSPAKIGRAHV